MTWDILENRSYVPYSAQPKACVVKGNKGGFYHGVRIENVSFPLTISAIQAACLISLHFGETPETIFTNNNSTPQLDFWMKEFSAKHEVVKVLPTDVLQDYSSAESNNKKGRLVELLDQAIIPQSDFAVSAILESKARIYEGTNVEVSDWNMGLCAERVAISKAYANGDSEFNSISVHTKKGEFSSPCGACRQVMFEHMPLSKVYLFHADHTNSEHFITDLLPFSFTSKALRKQ